MDLRHYTLLERFVNCLFTDLNCLRSTRNALPTIIYCCASWVITLYV